MTTAAFTAWVAVACQVLGGVDRFREVLLANADVFIGDWRATSAELADCLRRLVSLGRVPQWPNEVTNAIRRELFDLRREQREQREEAELRAKVERDVKRALEGRAETRRLADIWRDRWSKLDADEKQEDAERQRAVDALRNGKV